CAEWRVTLRCRASTCGGSLFSQARTCFRPVLCVLFVALWAWFPPEAPLLLLPLFTDFSAKFLFIPYIYIPVQVGKSRALGGLFLPIFHRLVDQACYVFGPHRRRN